MDAEILAAARGETAVDLLFSGGRVVNVFTCEIEDLSVAVHRGRVVGFGEYPAQQKVDLQGRYLCPGLVDAHVHIESSMVTPAQFARAVVPRGTTTVVTDPHEIANVCGLPGIEFMLESASGCPLDMRVMMPSCVPATHLETAGATLDGPALASLEHPAILGLAEVMDYPGVIHANPAVLDKLRRFQHRVIDGHAPAVSGRELFAYISAGIGSDHECTTAPEALEKLRRGLFLMIREGSVTRDLEALLPVVTAGNAERCMFCTDDREPADLVEHGHLDFVIRKAVQAGCDPITAIRLATINPCRYFRLHRRGAIAPGYRADLVITSDLADFRPERVYVEGRLVAQEGSPLWQPEAVAADRVKNTVRLPELSPDSFAIAATGSSARVIRVLHGKILTEAEIDQVKVENGSVVSDTERDLLKIAVVERHGHHGQIGLGLVRGFGFQRGAIASTVAHDSHNLVVAGVDERDMCVAARRLRELEGGWVAVIDGEVKAELALPIAGLMSDRPIEEAQRANSQLTAVSKEMGGLLGHPFMALSFLALPVIPSLKLSDQGLVDVEKFEHVPLFV